MKKLIGVMAAGVIGSGALHAYNWKQAANNLTPKEQAFAAAAATAAVGNLPKLTAAFNRALDEGWTVNELKEMVLQLYAYTGFPRCLNASATLEQVVKARAAQGKQDVPGQTPAQIPAGTDKYELGRQNLARLIGQDIPSRPAAFIQDTDTFLKEHLFADIFARGILTDEQREMATVSFLTALGNVNSQQRSHMGLAINVGVTPAQIEGICAVVKQEVGRREGVNGLAVLKEVTNK
ncbi:MAG: carboxymuconolactone decarboxylase family protein [Candidatus Avelusimicrobium sp.]|uniref:carboxymuconolactone decarboxylase family protein n=1 Tax=Candidatus Avelusimicrobium sp. TaxID=3048833 RepID=UPI003EFDB904